MKHNSVICLKFSLQKIIIQTVVHNHLYMCQGNLTQEILQQDSVYFLRNTEGMVPLPNTLEEANEQLPDLIEMGLLNGHSLNMLDNLITQVCTV